MKQNKKNFLTTLGDSWYLGLNPYYTPQKLSIVDPATTSSGNTSKTTGATGVGSTKADVATKPLGESTYADINSSLIPKKTTSSTITSTSTKAGTDSSITAATNKSTGTGTNTSKTTSVSGGMTNRGDRAFATAGTTATNRSGTGATKETTVNATGDRDTNRSASSILAEAYGRVNGQYANQSGLDQEAIDYLKRSGKQAVLGNYSGDVTALGTTLQVISGILGLDTAADVRDLYYDVTHWDGSKEHIIQTLLDVVGLIPVVGSLKYADEVGTLVKQGLKGADEAAATAAKTAPKQVYELPAGYKPDPLITDEEAKYLLAQGWPPMSTKPSPYFTDEELLKSWKTPEKGAMSNAVEGVGTREIDAAGEMGYNGGKGLPENAGNIGNSDIEYTKRSEELEKRLGIDGYKIVNTKTAEQANTEWADMGFDKSPVAPDTKVFHIEAGNKSYSRVYCEGYNYPKSRFVLRTEDIDGLSAQEIADKYALPRVPNKVVHIKMPENTPLEVTIVGPQEFNSVKTYGGEVQYAIKEIDLMDEWFENIEDLD